MEFNKHIKSPFVAVLEHIGIPAAAQIMNFIVLTAVLSCLNSGLYTNSRMLFNGRKRRCSKVILKLNSSGVPVRAVYLELSSLILELCLVTFLQIKSFVLVNASGGIALLVYLVIAVSHLKMRKNGESRTTKFESENVAFPYVTYVTIAAIIAVLVAMFAIDTYVHKHF